MLPNKRREKMPLSKLVGTLSSHPQNNFSSGGEGAMHSAKFERNVLKTLVAIAGNKPSTKRMKAGTGRYLRFFLQAHGELQK